MEEKPVYRSIIGTSFMQTGVIRVMYRVLIPKLLPRSRVARIKSGTEMHSVIADTGIFVIREKMIASPVIPPGASPVH